MNQKDQEKIVQEQLNKRRLQEAAEVLAKNQQLHQALDKTRAALKGAEAERDALRITVDELADCLYEEKKADPLYTELLEMALRFAKGEQALKEVEKTYLQIASRPSR